MFPDESCTITPWTCFMSSTLAWGWCVLALCWSWRWVFRRAFGVLELICHAAGSVRWVRSRDRPVIGFWSSGHGHWKHLTAPLFLSLSLLWNNWKWELLSNRLLCEESECVSCFLMRSHRQTGTTSTPPLLVCLVSLLHSFHVRWRNHFHVRTYRILVFNNQRWSRTRLAIHLLCGHTLLSLTVFYNSLILTKAALL